MGGAIDADGYFHTGDIGEITEFGSLKIIDRKKNIFKLSQGEYVAVEVLESNYKKNLHFEQIWVYGNSFENCLVAIVEPNAMLLSELKKTGKEAKMKGFEIVRAIHLDSVEFSVENDLLTPTFKLKRPQLLKHYQTEVDALYAGLKT